MFLYDREDSVLDQPTCNTGDGQNASAPSRPCDMVQVDRMVTINEDTAATRQDSRTWDSSCCALMAALTWQSQRSKQTSGTLTGVKRIAFQIRKLHVAIFFRLHLVEQVQPDRSPNHAIGFWLPSTVSRDQGLPPASVPFSSRFPFATQTHRGDRHGSSLRFVISSLLASVIGPDRGNRLQMQSASERKVLPDSTFSKHHSCPLPSPLQPRFEQLTRVSGTVEKWSKCSQFPLVSLRFTDNL